MVHLALFRLLLQNSTTKSVSRRLESLMKFFMGEMARLRQHYIGSKSSSLHWMFITQKKW